MIKLEYTTTTFRGVTFVFETEFIANIRRLEAEIEKLLAELSQAKAAARAEQRKQDIGLVKRLVDDARWCSCCSTVTPEEFIDAFESSDDCQDCVNLSTYGFRRACTRHSSKENQRG